MKRLSSETLTAAVAAYEAGALLKEIKREHGVWRTTLYRHLRRRGVAVERHGPRRCRWCNNEIPRGQKGTLCGGKACEEEHAKQLQAQKAERRHCPICNTELPSGRLYCGREHERTYKLRRREERGAAVARLVARGKSVKQIAFSLSITEYAVRYRLAAIGGRPPTKQKG